MDFEALLKQVIALESPDLHLQVGQPPVIRQKNGDLQMLSEMPKLSAEEVYEVIKKIASPEQLTRFQNDHEVDFSYQVAGVSRFRVNAYQERHGAGVAFRVISEKIPQLESLGLTGIGEQLASLPHGLVLVTGTTGMGKSTTLASIIDHINQTRNTHIITVEDPIEFTYESKKSLVTQREVNVHTRSFPSAIRSALRQDPDVILVGEMRDLETIAAAITLAETGHLVFSTLHTSDAAQTVDRMIDVFPAYQQQQIRAQLSNCLMGVISQVLIPRADGKGRVAARELMLSNDAIRNCIAKGETHQIYSIMQISGQDGMILMDKALSDLVNAGQITLQEALGNANDPEMMQNLMEIE